MCCCGIGKDDCPSICGGKNTGILRIREPAQAGDGSAVLHRCGHSRAGCRIPNPHAAILASRGQLFSILAPANRTHSRIMADQCRFVLQVLSKANRGRRFAVGETCERQALPLGTPCQPSHQIFRRNLCDEFPRGGFPDSHESIHAAGREFRPIRLPGYAQCASLVAMQNQTLLPGCQIENANRVILSGCRDLAIIRAESDGIDIAPFAFGFRIGINCLFDPACRGVPDAARYGRCRRTPIASRLNSNRCNP